MNYIFDLFTFSVCDPSVVCATGIETIGVMMAAISAAMSVASGISQSQAAKQQSLNAEAAAEQEQITGQAESARIARINQAKQAELRANAGAQGTSFSGSPMEVYLENAKQAALEEADPLYGAATRSNALKQSASLYNRSATTKLVSGIGEGVGALGSLTSTLVKPTATAPQPRTVFVPADQYSFTG